MPFELPAPRRRSGGITVDGDEVHLRIADEGVRAGPRRLDGAQDVLERDDVSGIGVAAHAEPGLQQAVRPGALRLAHLPERQTGARARREAELEPRVVFECEARFRALLRVEIFQEGVGGVGHGAAGGGGRAVERHWSGQDEGGNHTSWCKLAGHGASEAGIIAPRDGSRPRRRGRPTTSGRV